MEAHKKYGSFSESELLTMANWLNGYWVQRRDPRNQTEFAKLVLGISQPALNQIFKGVRPVPEEQFFRLCTALDIPSSAFRSILRECPTYQKRIKTMLIEAKALNDFLGTDWLVERVLVDS